jgi:hypothetical protein
MKRLPDSERWLGIGFLVVLAIGGCGRPAFELDVSVQGDDVVFVLRNSSGGSINVSSGLLDTAKSPDGDLVLEVRGPSGQKLPHCGLIDSHEPTSRISVEHGEAVEFREDAELVRAVYCLEKLEDASFSLAYSKIESGDWEVQFRTEFVEVDRRP